MIPFLIRQLHWSRPMSDVISPGIEAEEGCNIYVFYYRRMTSHRSDLPLPRAIGTKTTVFVLVSDKFISNITVRNKHYKFISNITVSNKNSNKCVL